MKTALKLRILTLLYLSFLTVILARTFYWQVIEGEKLTVAAEKQHFSLLDVPAVRGTIKTRDGFHLVSNRQSFWLYANRQEITDSPEAITAKIAPIIVESNPGLATDSAELNDLEETISGKLGLEGVVWVKIAPGISQETRTKIADLNVSGLDFVPQVVRDYPEASMAAHLIGFVGESADGKVGGKFGIEGFFDRELSGRPGQLIEERDAESAPILIGLAEKQSGFPGSDVEVTIDRTVQLAVEKHLADGIRTWGAAGGTAVVMNPQTGDLLAAASFPNFEPKNYFLYPNEVFKDPMISDLFEPGSILKPIVMAAALNEKKLAPQSLCPRCSGPVTIGEYSIHTFNNQYHPQSTMTEVLVNSDNTGMVFVGESLGFSDLYNYLKKFGLDSRTGISLAGEETSTLRPLPEWYPIDRATVTFGQGVAVTPLQMIRAFAVLANDGKMVAPRVVSAVVSRGERQETPVDPPVAVIDAQTAREVSEMLVQVAKESPLRFPLGRTRGLDNFRIAAKSGTAQVPIAGHYEKDRTIGSVIGFAPASGPRSLPRFVVLVILDSPTVRPWGSDTAGPVFFNIMADVLHYYGVNPM